MLVSPSCSSAAPPYRVTMALALATGMALTLSFLLSLAQAVWSEGEVPATVYSDLLYAYQQQGQADQADFRYLIRQALEDGRVVHQEASQLLLLTGFCTEGSSAPGCVTIPPVARKTRDGKTMLAGLAGDKLP